MSQKGLRLAGILYACGQKRGRKPRNGAAAFGRQLFAVYGDAGAKGYVERIFLIELVALRTCQARLVERGGLPFFEKGSFARRVDGDAAIDDQALAAGIHGRDVPLLTAPDEPGVDGERFSGPRATAALAPEVAVKIDAPVLRWLLDMRLVHTVAPLPKPARAFFFKQYSRIAGENLLCSCIVFGKRFRTEGGFAACAERGFAVS